MHYKWHGFGIGAWEREAFSHSIDDIQLIREQMVEFAKLCAWVQDFNPDNELLKVLQASKFWLMREKTLKHLIHILILYDTV